MSVEVSKIYRSILEEQLPEKRLNHVYRVSETCGYLANRYGADPEKAQLAGLFHDLAKYQTPERFLTEYHLEISESEQYIFDTYPSVWHAFVAPQFVRHFFPEDRAFDEEVCRAMKWHTTGTAQMTVLDKILYVGDYIEPKRQGDAVELIRAWSEQDLDQAVLGLSTVLLFQLLLSGRLIHPESLSCRNAAMLRCSDRVVQDCLGAICELSMFKKLN